MPEFGRVNRGVMRVGRRTIRRMIIITTAVLITRNNASYFSYKGIEYPVLKEGDKYVIEDPDDEEGYIELQITN